MTSFPTTLDSHDSLEPQRAFVALYDVLGFTSRMRLKGLDQVRVGYRKLTRTKLDVAGLVPVFSGLGGQYRRLASTIFSDTVLLWCDDNWEAVQTLITGAANLIATAVDMGWPLRGGLAYGDCVLDRQSRTFIGEPIIDAYEAEQSQLWIGAALTRSLTNHPLLGERIRALEDVVQYRVPTKESNAPLDYAVHWCPYGSRSVIELQQAMNASEEKFRVYYRNTIAYVQDKCQGYHSAATTA